MTIKRIFAIHKSIHFMCMWLIHILETINVTIVLPNQFLLLYGNPCLIHNGY